MTPRQAAHEDLRIIVAQLAGRSRWAQRAFLEDQLVRALERAHVAEDQRARLDKDAAAHEQQRTNALRELAQIRGECRERMLQIRAQLIWMAEDLHALESACRAALPLTTFDLGREPWPREPDTVPDAEPPTQPR